MKKSLLNLIAAFLFAQQTNAGTITEISIFSHPKTNGQIVLFGEAHLEDENVAKQQWSHFENLIDKARIAKNRGKEFRFIVESSDSKNLFSRLHEELDRTAGLGLKLDVRRVFSEVLSNLEKEPGAVADSVNSILNSLRAPIDKLSEHPELSLALQTMLAERKKQFGIFEQEVNGMLTEVLLENTDLETFKATTFAELVKNTDDIDDMVSAMAQIFLSQASSSENNLDIPDVFDLESIIAIFDAPADTVTIHVAGQSHKARIEKLLDQLGFIKQVSHTSEHGSKLEAMNGEIEVALTGRFGKQPKANQLEAMSAFIVEKMSELSPKYAPLIMIDHNSFIEALNQININ